MQRKLCTMHKKKKKKKNHITIFRIKIRNHLIIKLPICENFSHLCYRQDKNNATQSRWETRRATKHHITNR